MRRPPKSANFSAGFLCCFKSARHNAFLWKNPHIRFMKQELPFAVALLAGGCLLWFSQSAKPWGLSEVGNTQARLSSDARGMPADADESVTNQRQRLGASESAGATDLTNPTEVALASYQVDAIEIDEQSSDERSGFRQIQSSNSISSPFVHAQTSPESLRVLTQVSKSLAASKPFHSAIRLTGNMFGQTVSATGNYHQLGQGTSKSRIELDFAGLPNAPSVLQLCDGRFVYKLHFDGNDEAWEFVDLKRIREAAGITPTGWIATGGISSLFQQLASAFNFGEFESVDESTIVLRGSWEKSALDRIVATFHDHGEDAGVNETTSRWDEIPSQLPHAVELVFRKEPGFQYFPRRVSFKRFVIEQNVMQIESSVTLEISPPRPLVKTNRLFVIDSSGLESTDATDLYISRIKQFERTLQAAATNPTLDR
jgi:hypothetical protein